jgi:hypothetical protein
MITASDAGPDEERSPPSLWVSAGDSTAEPGHRRSGPQPCRSGSPGYADDAFGENGCLVPPSPRSGNTPRAWLGAGSAERGSSSRQPTTGRRADQRRSRAIRAGSAPDQERSHPVDTSPTTAATASMARVGSGFYWAPGLPPPARGPQHLPLAVPARRRSSRTAIVRAIKVKAAQGVPRTGRSGAAHWTRWQL